MSGTNPLIQQGTLNRVRCAVLFGSYSNLNVTSEYMSKSFATITFDDPFVTQIPTATGIVNSPEPYVMSTISFGLLRTQPLATSWLSQINATSTLGAVTIVSDTSAFAPISLANASVLTFNPSSFDGLDATVSTTIRGVYYPNLNLWTFT